MLVPTTPLTLVDKNHGVELLHFSHFTMSHWSSRLTVCFPPQGAAVRARGVQPTLWNWDYLLAPSHYIGDLDVIPDHWPK